jgi:hypothetical protein
LYLQIARPQAPAARRRRRIAWHSRFVIVFSARVLGRVTIADVSVIRGESGSAPRRESSVDK